MKESLIQSVSLSPAPKQWPALAATFARSRPAAADEFRKSLDILADGLVIMSGHQAEFWHAGILAKWIAMTAAAEATRANGTAAESIWLVVDQDDNDPAPLRYPTHNGRTLGEETWKLSSPSLIAPGVPTGSRPPLEPKTPPAWKDANPPADAAVFAGIERITQALNGFKTTRNAAEQLGLSAAAICRYFELEGSKNTELLMATDLARTAAFKSIIEKMIADPAACVEHYNKAITQADQADLRPLQINTERKRYELPLWLLSPNEPRKRVFNDDLAALPKDQWERLAPRAILMTGLVRAYACDLFIHGAGGSRYDAAAEAWFASWLSVTLCPKVSATATVYLPLADKPVPTPGDVNRAWWKVHRAKHDPTVIGDHAAAQAKRELLEVLAGEKAAGTPQREHYLQMHQLLTTYRESNKPMLDRLVEEAESTSRRASEAGIATDRTWPFALHSPEVIHKLRDQIRATFK